MSNPLAAQSALEETGEKLRRARRAADMTLDQLAAITGIDASTICRIEQGGRPRLAVVDLITIGDALDLEALDLITPFIQRRLSAAAS